MTKKLEALGIPFLNRGSGLYIWMNLKMVSSGMRPSAVGQTYRMGPGLSSALLPALVPGSVHL